MKTIVATVVLAAVLCFVSAKKSNPRVSVYSRNPGEFGKDNTLICHTSQFYPPNIKITLLKNDKEMDNNHQTDLTFNQDWHFQLTKTAAFKPEKGDVYACKVTHDGETKIYNWEPDM